MRCAAMTVSVAACVCGSAGGCGGCWGAAVVFRLGLLLRRRCCRRRSPLRCRRAAGFVRGGSTTHGHCASSGATRDDEREGCAARGGGKRRDSRGSGGGARSDKHAKKSDETGQFALVLPCPVGLVVTPPQPPSRTRAARCEREQLCRTLCTALADQRWPRCLLLPRSCLPIASILAAACDSKVKETVAQPRIPRLVYPCGPKRSVRVAGIPSHTAVLPLRHCVCSQRLRQRTATEQRSRAEGHSAE